MSDKLSLNEIVDIYREAPGPQDGPAHAPADIGPQPQSVIDESAPLIAEAKSVFKYPRFYEQKVVQSFDSDLLDMRANAEMHSNVGLGPRDYELWFSDLNVDDAELLAHMFDAGELPDDIDEPIRMTFNDAYGRAFELAAWDWSLFDDAASEFFSGEARDDFDELMGGDYSTPDEDDLKEFFGYSYDDVASWFSVKFDQKKGEAVVTFNPPRITFSDAAKAEDINPDLFSKRWAKPLADKMVEWITEAFIKKLREWIGSRGFNDRINFADGWKQMMKENKTELAKAAKAFDKWCETNGDEYNEKYGLMREGVDEAADDGLYVKFWDGSSQPAKNRADAVQIIKKGLRAWMNQGDKIGWQKMSDKRFLQDGKPNRAFTINKPDGEPTDAEASILVSADAAKKAYAR